MMTEKILSRWTETRHGIATLQLESCNLDQLWTPDKHRRALMW